MRIVVDIEKLQIQSFTDDRKNKNDQHSFKSLKMVNVQLLLKNIDGEKKLGEDTKITLFVNQKLCNPNDGYTKEMLNLTSRMVFVKIGE